MSVSEAGPSSAPRQRSRRRLRHFLLQLLPVTTGILIALAIGGLIDDARQRSLARAAHAALAAEIADNARVLDDASSALAAMAANLDTIAQLVDDILERGRSNAGPVDYGLDLPSLQRASWLSAERSGALAHMEFAEVREYAALYVLQERVENSQRELQQRIPGLGVIERAMASGDPEGYTLDFQNIRKNVAEFRSAVGLHGALAQRLAEAYAAVPCRLDSCVVDANH